MAASRTVIPIKQMGSKQPESPEAALLREGWMRKTVIGEPRLSELVENYKAMGYEVHVVPFKTEGDGCNTCFDAGAEMGQAYGTVYVRKGGKPVGGDELF